MLPGFATLKKRTDATGLRALEAPILNLLRGDVALIALKFLQRLLRQRNTLSRAIIVVSRQG
jgi:hypothetical protein